MSDRSGESENHERQAPSGLVVGLRWTLLLLAVVFLLMIWPGFRAESERWKFDDLRAGEENGLIPLFDYRCDLAFRPAFEEEPSGVRTLRIEGKTQLGWDLTTVLQRVRITTKEDISDKGARHSVMMMERHGQGLSDRLMREPGSAVDELEPPSAVLRLIPRGERRPRFTIVTQPGFRVVSVYRGEEREVVGIANLPLHEILALLRGGDP